MNNGWATEHTRVIRDLEKKTKNMAINWSLEGKEAVSRISFLNPLLLF